MQQALAWFRRGSDSGLRGWGSSKRSPQFVRSAQSVHPGRFLQLVGADVIHQRAPALEHLRAEVAGVRPPAPVHHRHVLGQAGLLAERLATELAPERPLPRVVPQVVLEVSRALEPRRAHVAPVRCGAVVAPHVLGEQGERGESLAARATLRQRWLGVVHVVARHAVLVVDGEATHVAVEGVEALQLQPQGLVLGNVLVRFSFLVGWEGIGRKEKTKQG